jgi:hypothetical protein
MAERRSGFPVLLIGGIGCGLFALLLLCGGGIGLAVWLGAKADPEGILGGGGQGPGKANVSKENLQKIDAGMPLDEVNAILGNGKVADHDDMERAFGDFGLDPTNKWMGHGNNIGVAAWRQWQDGDQSIFVGFAKGRKSGKELVLISFWVKRKANGFESDIGVRPLLPVDDPDELAHEHEERTKLLNHPKWKGDAKVRIIGKWLDEANNGYQFNANGTYSRLGFAKYDSTYRFTADDQIELTIPAGAEIVGGKARTESHKVWVSDDEMLMQHVTGRLLWKYRRVK